MYTASAFDLEDYATTYRATRDAYLKAANELKLATGPYKAARDAYVSATATYTKSLYERRRLNSMTLDELERLSESPGKLFTHFLKSSQDTTTMGMDELERLSESPISRRLWDTRPPPSGYVPDVVGLDYNSVFGSNEGLKEHQRLYSWYYGTMSTKGGLEINQETEKGINEVSKRISRCKEYAGIKLKGAAHSQNENQWGRLPTDNNVDSVSRQGYTGDANGMTYDTTTAGVPVGAEGYGGTRRDYGNKDTKSDQVAHGVHAHQVWVPEDLCFERVGSRAFLRSIH